jgi:predicted SprT family Zn-dependent metalloprotease
MRWLVIATPIDATTSTNFKYICSHCHTVKEVNSPNDLPHTGFRERKKYYCDNCNEEETYDELKRKNLSEIEKTYAKIWEIRKELMENG